MWMSLSDSIFQVGKINGFRVCFRPLNLGKI